MAGIAPWVKSKHLAFRAQRVNNFFPGALGLDDFIARVEIALFNNGFTGQNSIGELHPPVDLNVMGCNDCKLLITLAVVQLSPMSAAMSSQLSCVTRYSSAPAFGIL